MFLSIIIGAAFGFGTAFAAGPLTELTRSRFTLNERETGIFTFGLMLLVATLVGSILTSYLSGFWLIFGGLLGVFGLRLKAAAEKLYAERSSTEKTKAENEHESAIEVVEDETAKNETVQYNDK